ncbi:hypothetical protein Tco_0460764, partial [Tanacetum coccineum]
ALVKGIRLGSVLGLLYKYILKHESVPMPPKKPEPPDLVVVQSHSGTDYHQPMSQLSDISGSACPEYPLSQHKYPACPAPGLQQARSP